MHGVVLNVCVNLIAVSISSSGICRVRGCLSDKTGREITRQTDRQTDRQCCSPLLSRAGALC